MLQSDDVESIFAILEKDFPFSKTEGTELRFDTKYQLLIAIVLSAQSQDVVVNKVTNILFNFLKTPNDAINLGYTKINNYIKSLNHHNVKTKYIIELSKQMINLFHGKIPNNFEDLIKLSGVGRKTANLFLSLAYKKPYIAVDTHVFRVSNRIGLVDAKNVLDTEKQLTKIVPKSRHRDINSLFIPFGRKYCRSRYPKCGQCPLKSFCKRYKKLNNK